MHRFKVFCKHLEDAAALQAVEPDAEYGVTVFADWTDEEFEAYTPTVDDIDMDEIPTMPMDDMEPLHLGDSAGFDWYV
jgi:hypothetical protein